MEGHGYRYRNIDAHHADFDVLGKVACCITVPGEYRRASVINDDEADVDLEPRVRDQLRSWFGVATDSWRTLKVYRVRRALPKLPAGAAMARPGYRELEPGLWAAGDHLATPSIQGAMGAGRQVAEAMLGT